MVHTVTIIGGDLNSLDNDYMMTVTESSTAKVKFSIESNIGGDVKLWTEAHDSR